MNEEESVEESVEDYIEWFEERIAHWDRVLEEGWQKVLSSADKLIESALESGNDALIENTLLMSDIVAQVEAKGEAR